MSLSFTSSEISQILVICESYRVLPGSVGAGQALPVGDTTVHLDVEVVATSSDLCGSVCGIEWSQGKGSCCKYRGSPQSDTDLGDQRRWNNPFGSRIVGCRRTEGLGVLASRWQIGLLNPGRRNQDLGPSPERGNHEYRVYHKVVWAVQPCRSHVYSHDGSYLSLFSSESGQRA